MLRVNKKTIDFANSSKTKVEKSSSHTSVSIPLNLNKTAISDSMSVKCSGDINSESCPCDSKSVRRKKSEIVIKCSEDNQLHPDSIFQTNKRTVQPRRASYDRHHNVGSSEFTNTERRASYDVSYLKTDPLHMTIDSKSSRRNSLVRRWFKRISDAAEAHKLKDNKQKNDRTLDVSSVPTYDLDNCENSLESTAKAKENDNCNSNENSSGTANTRHFQDELSPQGNDSTVKKGGSGGSGGTSPGLRKKRIPNTEPPRLTTEVPLIEPSQVLVSQRPVHTAEPVLTPLERLRRKDDVIKEALLEKQKLVADILHVPKEEFETVADLAAEPAYDKEASELVLAAVNQADQLTSILNECLRISEEDVVAASCEVNTNVTSKSLSNANTSVRTFPGIPVPKLQSITHSLSAHLTQLLTLMTERDEEREKLRQELQRSREQLHAMHEMQQRSQRISDQSVSPNESTRNSTNDPGDDTAETCVQQEETNTNVKK